ncbi:3257_t:CDS:2 [Diversispora eburnea]|uniref:3257_t:CDS:1 n=1 Tax=Diversispora eburnea TaxID=1213867 RepID=A0A9N8V0Y4_9GLOM|nr:3257_t:CDS:2 [Diversispora eburnea]
MFQVWLNLDAKGSWRDYNSDIETWFNLIGDSKTHLTKVPIICNKSTTILIAFLEILAMMSARKEWKFGMYVFFVLWPFAIMDFVAILCFAFIVMKNERITFALLTWIWSIYVYFNFNKGLKGILEKDSDVFSPQLETAMQSQNFVIDE